MTANILLFGASGNLGKEIIKELRGRNFLVTAVIHNKSKFQEISSLGNRCIIADATKKENVVGLSSGMDVVISALGKSVSPNDKAKQTFYEIDFIANQNILDDAKHHGVKKFIYVSAFHSERYRYLEYFRVHHEFSELLINSRLNYSIVKPPALFSAYVELLTMAKKGQLVSFGPGEKRTNPIHERDIAKICVDAINTQNTIIEAGGKKIYTRKELLEIIQREADATKKIRIIPIGVMKFFLPLIKLTNKNLYDKLAFFLEVLQHDTIAPQIGESDFTEYIRKRMKS